MTSLAGVVYDGPLPLDLRVRKDHQENDLFTSEGPSLPTSVHVYPSGGGLIENRSELFRMKDSLLKFVKEETDIACYEYTTTTSRHFSISSMETRHIKTESELYPVMTGKLDNVPVKKEPSETDETVDYFNPRDEPYSDTDNLTYLSKVEENSCDDEGTLIIDFNIEETTSGKKRIGRSNSNCSSNSNSSSTSDAGDDVKAFLLNFSNSFKEHPCAKCKMRFSNLYSLFVHLDDHASQNPGEKFMKCPVCQRKFQNIVGMGAHIRKMHLGPMLHVCRFCQLPFKFNLHLQKHELGCRKRKKKDCNDGNEICA